MKAGRGKIRTLPAGSAHAARGFTLLEVLIALVIFGFAFGAIAGIFQTALRQSASAETLMRAQALAEQQMARVGSEIPLYLNEQTGLSTAGLAWRTSIELAMPIEDDDDVALYRVRVEVTEPESEWSYITLTTLRVGRLP